jgi:hypothetical protein
MPVCVMIFWNTQQIFSRQTFLESMCFSIDGKLPFFLINLLLNFFFRFTFKDCWPGSSVGIATAYGLDGPGIESRWGRDFPHLSRPSPRPTQPPVRWVPGLSGGKVRPGCDADPSPPSSAEVKNRKSYTSTLRKGLRGLWNGETYRYEYTRHGAVHSGGSGYPF